MSVFYFGFGSNVSEQSLRMKQVECLSRKRAYLNDWRIVFNIHNPTFAFVDPAFANIQPLAKNVPIEDHISSLEKKAHGVIIEISNEDAEKLDRLEGAYIPKLVEATIYEDDGGGVLECFAYHCDDEVLKELRKKLAYESKLQLKECTPGENYLKTMLRGAKTMNLDAEWIRTLESLEYRPTPPFDWNAHKECIMQNEFSMDQIVQSKETGPPFYTYCLGVVILFKEIKHPFEQRFAGSDLVPMMGQRFHGATGEPVTGLEDMTEPQRLYVEAMIEFVAEGRQIVGHVPEWKEFILTRCKESQAGSKGSLTPLTSVGDSPSSLCEFPNDSPTA